MRFLALLLVLSTPLLAARPALPGLRWPAEFEPHAAVWLAWPTYENVAGRPSSEVTVAIARALSGRVPVLVAVNGAEDHADASSKLAGVKGVRLVPLQHADLWMRDTGGTFVTSGAGPRVVDFRFNGWGYAPRSQAGAEAARVDGVVDRRVAAAHRIPSIYSPMIMEGGALESNGDGAVLTTASVMFQRNPRWTRALAESELARTLGATRVVWLERGVPEDDLSFEGRLADGTYTVITTGGHVDEFARFAGPRTVLLAQVSAEEAATDPIAAEARRRLEQNAAILARCGYSLVRLPVPLNLQETFKKGDGVFDFLAGLTFTDPREAVRTPTIRGTMAASYLNYLVTNGVVVGQRYWKPGRPREMARRDAEARAKLAAAFPGRTIEMIDAENVNLGGGGVHCITQQVPAGVPLPE